MRGYVYVMVNASFPDLVKIGKTTRIPAERAEELSAVTGVPTPFMVAFEQAFEDCGAAEDFVHAMLEQRGLRTAANREFFCATPGDATRAILMAPNPISAESLISTNPFEEEPFRPWEYLMAEAGGFQWGLEGYLQDYRKAFSLYKEAAKLGCAEAYDSLASMTEEGMGTQADPEKAIDLRQKSAELGYYPAYSDLMMHYAEIKHEYNFHTCAMKMLDARRAKISRNELPLGRNPLAELHEVLVSHLVLYLFFAFKNQWQPHFVPEMKIYRKEIQSYVKQRIAAGDAATIVGWLKSQIS